VIDYLTFCRLRALADQKHLTLPQIAAELHLDPKTVAKWVTRPTYQQRQRAKRTSKLEPFKGQIVRMQERHPYTAQQVIQEIRTQGYAGGCSILKDFVRWVRPVCKPAFLMLVFAAGECAQVDWGSYGSLAVGSTHRRLSFFVMVLCYTFASLDRLKTRSRNSTGNALSQQYNPLSVGKLPVHLKTGIVLAGTPLRWEWASATLIRTQLLKWRLAEGG
jgi:hypothetical protein